MKERPFLGERKVKLAINLVALTCAYSFYNEARVCAQTKLLLIIILMLSMHQLFWLTPKDQLFRKVFFGHLLGFHPTAEAMVNRAYRACTWSQCWIVLIKRGVEKNFQNISCIIEHHSGHQVHHSHITKNRTPLQNRQKDNKKKLIMRLPSDLFLGSAATPGWYAGMQHLSLIFWTLELWGKLAIDKSILMRNALKCLTSCDKKCYGLFRPR